MEFFLVYPRQADIRSTLFDLRDRRISIESYGIERTYSSTIPFRGLLAIFFTPLAIGEAEAQVVLSVHVAKACGDTIIALQAPSDAKREKTDVN